MVPNQDDQVVDACSEIMRQASYLPLHSPERRAIEDAASALLRAEHSDGGDTSG